LDRGTGTMEHPVTGACADAESLASLAFSEAATLA
jgi:hypothetical protein